MTTPADDPPAPTGLEDASVAELFGLHRASLVELHRRKIVRTLNAPQGDWAELLVARAYGGELAPNSEKSWDVRTSTGRTLQVKCRVLDPDLVRSNITSPFRSWDFDAAVVVLLWPIDLSVARAVEFTVDQARERSRWRSHVNGAVMIPNRSTMDEGVDVTDRLAAAASLDQQNPT